MAGTPPSVEHEPPEWTPRPAVERPAVERPAVERPAVERGVGSRVAVRRINLAGALYRRLLVCAVVGSLGAACGPRGPYIEGAKYTPDPAIGRQDLIKVGDRVQVTVFGQEPLSTAGTVRPDGKIALPLIGDFVVANKRPTDLGIELEKALTAYVALPHVTVVVESSPVRVTVIGETGSSLLSLEWPLTRLVDVLASTGGPNEFADRSAIFVLRGNQRIRFDYDDILFGAPHATYFLMQTGDIVVVE